MSVIIVQRNFWRQFGIDPPDKNSIKHWHTQLMDTGCLCKGKSTGRPRSKETVDRVRQFFLEVSSTFQANFHHSTYWVPRKKIKKKGTFFFCRYERHVGASMDGNGVSPRYPPCHEGCLY
ncbi:DUF4817 domain-containing protein [Trichonephila clavipes]|nr:DUF4817 domain-containing protein [Trichonephila clavipes]